MWQYLKPSTFVAVAITSYASLFATNVNALGGYLVSGWLFSPLVSYWLIGSHDTQISFLVRVYPRAIRMFVLYGLFFSLMVLTIVWGVMLTHVYTT